jgi:hypothetical protein
MAMKVLDDLASAFNDHDVLWIELLLDPECVFYTPEGGTILGRAAMLEVFWQRFETYRDAHWALTKNTVTQKNNGDWKWITEWTYSHTNPDRSKHESQGVDLLILAVRDWALQIVQKNTFKKNIIS